MCFDHCLPFRGGSEEPQYNADFESGHFLFAGSGPVALGSAKHWWRILADQFSGRWLLALGGWIMVVKIDTLETVCRRIGHGNGAWRN